MSEIVITQDEILALAGRLKAARCWSDERSFGSRYTKWFHLSPADVDKAVSILTQIAKTP